MDDVEALLESVYTLYAKLAALKGIAGPELLLPGRTSTYKEVVADAYTAYRSVEVTVDALGQAVTCDFAEGHHRLCKRAKASLLHCKDAFAVEQSSK